VPGVLHQGILSLFCDDPWLGFDLLGIQRPADGIPIDRRTDLDRASDDEAKLTMRYPDVVLVVRDPIERERGIVMCTEVQRQLARNKRWRVSFYLGALEDEHELPACLVLVSFSRPVSADARTWDVGPGTRLHVLLIDADTVPPFEAVEAARVRPTAAVLVAALHACRGNLDAARIGILACRHLPEPKRERYISIILAAVPKRSREMLRNEMTMEHEEDELWEIERQSGTYLLGVENGLREGRRMTLVEVILAALDVRGVAVDADVEAQIRSCESLDTLQAWARRALVVSQARELMPAR
jgi:hypothetical protein